MEEENEEWEKQKEAEVFEFVKEGDIVIGTLKLVEENVGPNKSKLYTLEKREGELVKVWGSTILDQKLALVTPGTYTKIEYLGKVKPEKGNEYKNFEVYTAKKKQKDKDDEKGSEETEEE